MEWKQFAYANCFLLYRRKKDDPPQGLLVLFSEEKQNESRSFLRQFGIIYAILGIMAILVGLINNRSYSMMYLILLLVVAAIFALLMGSKTKKG